MEQVIQKYTRRDFFISSLTPALAGLLPPPGIEIESVGPIDITPRTPSVLFVSQEEVIHGRMPLVFRDRGVQLLKQRDNGPWIVAPSIASTYPLTGRSGFGWSVPVRIASADRSERLMAVVTKETLPAGLVMDSPRWRHVLSQSAAVQVSCASFERSRLRIVQVGGRDVLPGVPMPVSNFEAVTIQVQGLPRSAPVQIWVQPLDNARCWPSEHVEIVQDDLVTLTAYFGRPNRHSSVKEELDIHARFHMRVVATVVPMPARPEGFDPTGTQFRKFVRVESPKVELVRAMVGDGVDVRITRLGVSNDPTHRLAMPVSRVEGTFQAGWRYQPRSREFITLLVRERRAKSWQVAGMTTLGKNRAFWVISLADLQPQGTSADGDFVAIAVVTFRPFVSGRPVTDAEVQARRVGISDEKIYRVIKPQTQSERR
jgi:hypothetical protein